MGYRALLKKYLATIEEETGSLHLDRLEERPDERFSKRDLGELRALAAELCREGAPRRRPSPVRRSAPPPEPPSS